MFKSRILSYMESTSPETARNNNNASGRRCIREEAKRELADIMSVKETAKIIGMEDTVKELTKTAFYIVHWLVKFGVSDEE